MITAYEIDGVKPLVKTPCKTLADLRKNTLEGLSNILAWEHPKSSCFIDNFVLKVTDELYGEYVYFKFNRYGLNDTFGDMAKDMVLKARYKRRMTEKEVLEWFAFRAKFEWAPFDKDFDRKEITQ